MKHVLSLIQDNPFRHTRQVFSRFSPILDISVLYKGIGKLCCADPHQTPQNADSDQGLHCLLKGISFQTKIKNETLIHQKPLKLVMDSSNWLGLGDKRLNSTHPILGRQHLCRRGQCARPILEATDILVINCMDDQTTRVNDQCGV